MNNLYFTFYDYHELLGFKSGYKMEKRLGSEIEVHRNM
ncbi:hypothetical protein bcere0017_26160 [Bacillus cereus Rock1-3]|nr:hypothetical protein MC28_2006 [Bacillus thuringiensis MC28]EEL22612.1 hypothetical protein bcere0017_26160 [Bacillus cereus Rock1-3]EEL34111.1 hypothetical protein bcere0019_25700 [Bacillus cereus Rock3-28]EEL40060.1 hypothetical protein bcere0020_25760 [Bacillus cereus Rock3-29]PKR93020.1 Group-specific protein [Bacillus cereus Rock4-18]